MHPYFLLPNCKHEGHENRSLDQNLKTKVRPGGEGLKQPGLLFKDLKRLIAQIIRDNQLHHQRVKVKR